MEGVSKKTAEDGEQFDCGSQDGLLLSVLYSFFVYFYPLEGGDGLELTA